MTLSNVPEFVAGATAPTSSRPTVPRHRRAIVTWFAGGAVLTFVVAWIAADLLELHHDLYLLVYVTVVGTFLASFVAHTSFDVRNVVGRNLRWSMGVGAVIGLALVPTVLRDDSTSHPSGVFYVFEIAWRGVAYGVLDALILFVFPAAVASLLMGNNRDGIRRKISFAALTLGLSLVITATYHLGYGQFRSSDLIKPEIGAVFANVPAMLTGNPIGAVLAHVVFHVTANVHAYRSGIFLPPDLNGYTERGGGGVGLAIAVVWIVFAGGLVWWQRRRLFPTSQR
jgi:hypothetical protein